MFYGPKNLKLEEKEIQKIGHNEVLVRVRSIGIWGSDLRIYNFGSSSLKPRMVIGHEFAGARARGNCGMCVSGYENLCEKPLSFGYNVDGAYAEHIRIPSRFIERKLIFKLPSDLPCSEETRNVSKICYERKKMEPYSCKNNALCFEETVKRFLECA